MKIRNLDTLLSHGNIPSRKIVAEITERTLMRLDARERIKSMMHMDGSILQIGKKKWDLSKKKHVYLIGAGKACNHMAMAVDEILGDYLTRGIGIVKISEPGDRFRRTEIFVGGHPLPNEEGLKASKQILDLVEHSGPEDLFLCVISGGSSSLMSCPIKGISLRDEAAMTDIMLKSGANIFEINAIRRHISALNGGMLAKRIQQRGAELIGIGISDAVGTPATKDISIPYPAYRGTPIGPDQTTLDDARRVMKDYNVLQKLPASIVGYLMHAGPEQETPKAFSGNTYYLLNSLPDSCLYAKEAAQGMGIPAMILTSFLEGEAKDAGAIFASIAREIQIYGNPFKAPCVVLASGEATTQITDNRLIAGHGGPSQEEVLGFALSACGIPGACLLSIDSEGTDGTTPAAGGMTDSTSLKTAEERNIDLHGALRGHAAFEALTGMEDVVYTGNTGTNLCDFNVLYIPAV